MKKLIVVIIILAIIFVGLVIYRNNRIDNNVSVSEIENIQKYIEKIYMWKEVTGEALPKFDDINQADEIWLWNAVGKNIESKDLSYENITNKSIELFGKGLNKKFPKEGISHYIYDSELDKYHIEGINLDDEKDTFLLNSIEKNKEEYIVNIVEYIEDYSLIEMLENEGNTNEEEKKIIIKNTKGEIIGDIQEQAIETLSKQFVKDNIDKFSKKKVYINFEKDNKMYIKKVEEI